MHTLISRLKVYILIVLDNVHVVNSKKVKVAHSLAAIGYVGDRSPLCLGHSI